MRSAKRWVGPVAVVLALVFDVAGSRAAGPMPGIDLGPPLILRLEGVLEPTLEAARAAGNDIVSMQVLGGDGHATLRYLGATDARTIGGDNALFGKDVLAMVAPFNPNFLLTGPPAMLERVEQLAPHSRVVLEGLVTRGGRTYYLRKVEEVAPDHAARTRHSMSSPAEVRSVSSLRKRS